MAHRFTSLRHSLEKLQEAEYFLAGLVASNGLEFQFNLNAFLSVWIGVGAGPHPTGRLWH